MTVSSVFDEYGELTALCSWFDGTRPETGKFPVTVLVHAEPPSGGFKSIRTARA
jgi:uncharacterized protein YodC (DUF2158 family)